MTYTVHYWRADLFKITGHEQGSEINELQLATLIRDQKVNVMVHHVPANPKINSDPKSYVYIDDLNHRFQQR
jgi:hypothetical protein